MRLVRTDFSIFNWRTGQWDLAAASLLGRAPSGPGPAYYGPDAGVRVVAAVRQEWERNRKEEGGEREREREEKEKEKGGRGQGRNDGAPLARLDPATNLAPRAISQHGALLYDRFRTVFNPASRQAQPRGRITGQPGGTGWASGRSWRDGLAKAAWSVRRRRSLGSVCACACVRARVSARAGVRVSVCVTVSVWRSCICECGD